MSKVDYGNKVQPTHGKNNGPEQLVPGAVGLLLKGHLCSFFCLFFTPNRYILVPWTPRLGVVIHTLKVLICTY